MTPYPFKSFWKRWLAGGFDAIGGAVVYPFKSLRKPLDIASVRRILVIRLDHIGDVVMSRPVLRALHKKFPHAAIDLLVTEDLGPLFENSKEIHAVIAAKHGWFNRKASFVQKWAEFWRLVGMLRAQTRDLKRLSPEKSRDTGSESKQDRVDSYDLGIDLRGDLRNILLMSLARVRYTIGSGAAGGGFLLDEDLPQNASLHQVRMNMNLLKSLQVTDDSKLQPFEYSAEAANEFWKRIETLPPTLLPRLAIHMGSGYPSKRWPIENFRALIQKIDREALAQIVLIGTQAEKESTPGFKPKEPHEANLCHPCEIAEQEPGAAPAGQEHALPTCGNDLLLETLNSERLIDLRGKTSMKDLPVLLDVCDVLIGNDSGPAHIAASQGLEVLLLASGTNDIRLWHPWTERLTLLRHEVPCSPCSAEVCPVEGHPCVTQISVDQAYDALLAILRRLQKKA